MVERMTGVIGFAVRERGVDAECSALHGALLCEMKDEA